MKSYMVRAGGVCILAAVLLALAACDATSTPAVSSALPSATLVPPTLNAPLAATAKRGRGPDVPPTPPARVPPTYVASPTPGVPHGEPSEVLRDVTYCKPDGVAVKMDIALPKAQLRPSPAALFIHGGAWRSGDRTHGGLVNLITTELLARGYVVAAADYRLGPRYRFPAQIEDVKCAVRFLRAKATTYSIDPTRIGTWGDSAGGHLVSLLGLTDSRYAFDGTGGYANESSAVQAVVDMFGPSDLALKVGPDGTLPPDLAGVFSPGDALTFASPVRYVTKNAPPFLIIQGDKDKVVPLIQSQELYDKLTLVGTPATLLVVKNAGHEFDSVGGPLNPTIVQIVQKVADFFDTTLRNGQKPETHS